MLDTLTYKEIVAAYNTAVVIIEKPERDPDPLFVFEQFGGDPERWPLLTPLVSMWCSESLDIVRPDYDFIMEALDRALDYLTYEDWLEDYEPRPSSPTVLSNTAHLFYALKAHDALHETLSAQANLLSAILGHGGRGPTDPAEYHCIAFPGNVQNHPIANAMIDTFQAFMALYDFMPMLYPVDILASSHQEQGPIFTQSPDTYYVHTTHGTVYLTRVPAGVNLGGLPPLRTVH